MSDAKPYTDEEIERRRASPVVVTFDDLETDEGRWLATLDQRTKERDSALARVASLKAVLGDIDAMLPPRTPPLHPKSINAQIRARIDAATRADEQAGDGARREASCQTERLTYNPMTVCPTCLCAYRDLRWNSGCDLEGRIYRGRRMDAAIVECLDPWHDSPRPDASRETGETGEGQK